ncbi:MAG: MarR family transcriptional regulator [Paracoccaceae bacterium]
MFDFEKIPIHWVNRLSVLSRRELGQRFKTAGYNISPEEWAILLLLWREDCQSPGIMSARTVRDPTTMTRLIDTMVRKDLVKRRADKSDRRRSFVCLTTNGQGLEPVLIAIAGPMIEISLTGVSQQEAATTLKVLRKMAENLQLATKKRGK